jgi:hypothetical protein
MCAFRVKMRQAETARRFFVVYGWRHSQERIASHTTCGAEKCLSDVLSFTSSHDFVQEEFQ